MALLATVVEGRPIMSVNIVSQFQPSTFGHNLLTLQRDFSAIAELLVIFTALHGMQTRSYDEISVRPFVCLSNACIVTKRKKDMFRFLYHTKEHLS